MSKVKINMNIDNEIKRKLKYIALDEDTTITNIINKLIVDFIDEYENKK